MISSLIDLFTRYSKKTGPLRMALHALILMAVSTWVGLVFLISTNFPTLTKIYENYRSISNIEVEKTLAVTNQVNKLIQEQRLLLGVDRLYVSKFHNGKLDLDGVHFLFFSRISESTGAGVSNEISGAQALPVSVFPQMLTEIANGECYYVEKVDSSIENYTFLKDMGARSMLVCPIWNSEKRITGIVGAEGVRKPINNEDRARIEAAMIPLSTVLGGLLSIR